MVQMDGSHHDWLEGRGEKMVLMGYIDDASSRFFGRFYEYEGVYPAMAIAKGDEYLNAEFPLLDRIERAVVEESGG